MLFILILADQAKPIPTFAFKHSSKQAYYDLYSAVTTTYKEDIVKFVNEIGTKFIDVKLPTSECETRMCTIFTKATGLTSTQFQLFFSFIETVIDPMMALHNGTQTFFAVSLTIDNLNKFRTEIYQHVQKLVIEINSTSGANTYKAITIAGFPGYLHLTHEGARSHAAFTPYLGEGFMPPLYNPIAHAEKMKKMVQLVSEGQIPVSWMLLKYCQESDEEAIVDNLKHYIVPTQGRQQYAQPVFIGLSTFNVSADSGFYSSANLSYFWTPRTNWSSIAQSSLAMVVKNPIESDWRTVRFMRSLQSKMLVDNFNSFANALKQYPFRTEYTPAIVGFGPTGQQSAFLSQCTSIFDGSETVNCADPPPPDNWVAISLSLVLIVLVLVAWVFGCLFAKREEQRLKYEAQEELEVADL